MPFSNRSICTALERAEETEFRRMMSGWLATARSSRSSLRASMTL